MFALEGFYKLSRITLFDSLRVPYGMSVHTYMYIGYCNGVGTENGKHGYRVEGVGKNPSGSLLSERLFDANRANRRTADTFFTETEDLCTR